jgi:hypothetical protein
MTSSFNVSRIRSLRRLLGGVTSLLQGGVALSADHSGDYETLGEANVSFRTGLLRQWSK